MRSALIDWKFFLKKQKKNTRHFLAGMRIILQFAFFAIGRFYVSVIENLLKPFAKLGKIFLAKTLALGRFFRR